MTHLSCDQLHQFAREVIESMAAISRLSNSPLKKPDNTDGNVVVSGTALAAIHDRLSVLFSLIQAALHQPHDLPEGLCHAGSKS